MKWPVCGRLPRLLNQYVRPLLPKLVSFQRRRGVRHMKPFTTAAIVVFTLVALAQFLRVVFGWDVRVNGFLIPIWASVTACAVAATLAVMLWREQRR